MGNGHSEKVPEIREAKFRVGVETEIPLAVTKRDEVGKANGLLEGTDALRELAILFNKHGLIAYDSAVDHEHDYSKWAITIDPSIEVGHELKGVGSPIEIKSPPMCIDKMKHGIRFRTMWEIIEPFMIRNIEYWKMASTHVHFSLKNTEFPIEVAQQLAFCVVYFEKAIDDILPGMTHAKDKKRPGGWKNCDRFAKRNRVRPLRNGRKPLDDLKSCWEAIRDTGNIYEIAELMCYDDDAYRRSFGQIIKNWKWNFKGIDFKTIEFRHMPPSRSAQETVDWITFTTQFVQAAADVNRDMLDRACDSREISFTEAVGLELSVDRQNQLDWEDHWAADGQPNKVLFHQFKYFMQGDAEFWDRIISIRDGIENELARLP
ncbi:hypothetical protein O1611_g5084 [Lasiodiplodia mahajangana]|uniref:Uncharacterized protein n=1 Tax=Lasiodiplodia mahajangana TaxID=1108764 RepID=A0ACC2JMD1_9PEZI|nr:hypothetical protein O1611_g5084 [Lasiodiplodia mahajangana]